MPNFAKDDKVTMPAMRDVTMPNGDVVSFPADMPAARIQSLIAAKFPNEVQGLLEKRGKADNPLTALGKAIVGAPGNIAIGAQGVAQMLAEGEAGDPNSFAARIGPDFTLSERPGLDEVNFLQWGRAQLGLDMSTPLTDAQLKQIEELGRDEKSRDAFMRYARSDDAIGTSPQRVAAEAFKGARAREAIKTIIPEVHTVPGSVAGLVGNVGGSVTQMLPGYLASLLIRNPAPAVALAQTLTTGQSYVDARAAGIDPGKAARYAMENGLAEAVGEALPLGMILKEGGGKLLPRLFKAGASEALQEGVTQFIQSMLQSGLISPDMTWGQVRGQVVEAMVGGMASGVLLGGGVALADRLTRPTIEDVNDKVFPPGAATPADTSPAALAPLPPPEVQLALPSPEAYAAPDIVRRQPSAPEPVAEPGPAPAEIEQQAKDALKRTRQAETVALLQTARETVSPIGTFDATELPADVAIKVNTHRARSGRDIDAPITVEDMARARVPQAQIDAAIVLRKPLTAGRQLTPRDVRNAARAKNIRIDDNFAELARRATGSANIEGMSQTQLSVLHDVVSGLPVHDAPVSVPIADTNPFTEKQYADAVAAVRRKGRYTLGAIKEGSGLKSDADARALRAAMVRRGQLVQRSANDYRLYDNLGVQTKPTAADLPNAAFVEHVVRQMPVGVVTVQRNGKSAGKFASQGEAADAVRRIRDEEAKAGVVGDKRAKIEVKPAGRVAYGVLENRYDEQGNFLGQAAVETYNDEAAARAAAAKLNDPARGATPRPEKAAPPEKLPPGKFIIRKDGKPLVGLNTAAEVREELRRLREENRRLGLKEPDLAIERAPGVTEAAPIVPKAPRKPVAPEAIAGRVGEVVARLTELGNTRGLPLLGTKVRLTPVVAGKTGTPVEGVFSPVQRLIRLSLHNLRPDMTTDEVVDVLAGVMDHETIHALKTAGVLDPQSDAWKTLVRYASKTRKKSLTDRERQVLAQNKLSDTYLDVARFLYTGRPGYDTPADIEEEAIAEVFRHWAADRRNVTGKPATVLRQIVEWFKRLIRAVPEDLLRSIESGALVRKKFAPPGSDAPRARTTQEMAQAKAGMAAAQAAGDKPRAQADVRRYVRARDQAREDRYGRAGDKTVLGDTPSLSYAVGEAPDPDAAEAVLRRYGEVSGQPAPRLPAYLPEPVAFLKTLAVAQEKARHAPKDDAVAKAYRALTAETRTMFDALGVKVELFSGPGEPYVSQRDMFDDVTTNKRVKLRLSTEQFGTSPENADHPMYAASGVTATDGTALTHNDLFRVVHEVYGHAPNGLRYQPRDAYNAYHAHRLLYSKDAIPALLTETLAQSAWQNYGAHMLRSDGTVPQTFDADYLPLDQRQYAKQKAYVLPDMVFEDPGVQAAAEAAQADALGPRTDVRESINSIEFQSWFGQSAVNENGVPTRVYHATSRVSFDEFDTTRSELGAHFGTLRQANAVGASKLNEQHADRARGRENDVGTHVYPVYLSIQRPLRLRDEGTFNNGAVADQLVDLGLLSEQEAEYLRAYGYQNRRALQDIIKSHGYDGAVYLNRLEGAPADTVPPSDKDLHELSDRMYRKKYPFARDSWIIFDPPQAKSAIANRGTYDRNNPDMRESLGNERFEAYAARAENELKPIEKTALPGIEHGLAVPALNEKDWDDKYSVTSPLFDETFGDRLPGGRLYGSNTIDPATAMSQPGVSPVALSAPVDGGQFFGGRLAEAQLRMAQDGIDGASMVYMRVGDFLRLAGDVIHPRQEVFNAAVADGMKFNGLPSIWFDGNDGVVNVLAIDGGYAARAIAGRADRIPVMIQRKGHQYFGSLVGFRRGAPPVEYRQDNPSASRGDMSWLQSKQAYADETYERLKGITGVTTGYFRKPVDLPTAAVASLPGARGENRVPGDHQYDALMQSVRENGWQQESSPILVEINHRGEPFIVEGNTRAAVAKALGKPYLRADVRWLNGGELLDGPWSPDKVMAMVRKEETIVAVPNGGLQEFYPERRGERMSVGSEAFNEWFGDSKVVDEQGRPLIVYRGDGGKNITNYNEGFRREPGLFFAEELDRAKYYGTPRAFYLKIENPLDLRDTSHKWLTNDETKAFIEAEIWAPYFEGTFNNQTGELFTLDDVLTATEYGALWELDGGFSMRAWRGMQKVAQSYGYDGIIVPDAGEGAGVGTSYIVYDSAQAKSATGNRGTWSAANPDTRESLNSPVGTRKVPQIDPDTYSVLHRETTSWLGRQMERIGRGDIGKADVPLVGETRLFRGIFGGSSIYEMRVANEDQFLSLFEFNERIRKEGGKITDEQNAYIAQQAAGSKATYRIQEHQRDIYDPLLAAIKAAHKAKKFTLKDYEKFLYARHAPERNAFLRSRGSKEPNPSGMSEAEASAIIDQFTKSGQLKDMLALDPLLARLRRSITDTRVSGGLLAPDAVSTVYEHWVPMQNGEDFDPFDTISRRSTFTGRGMSVAGRESRPVVGRGSKAGDLLSNMILQDTLAVVRSEHAAFNRKLVETIASNPALAQQDIEILSKPPLKTVVGSDGRIRTIVDPNFRSADNIYVTKIAGREVVMRVNNPWVSRALKGDFVHQTGPIVQSIGTVTRVLAAMRTTYNPTFVVTNLARDLQAAALNLTPQDIKGLSARMLAGVPRAGKAIGAYLISEDTSTEYGRYYEEMLTNGWTVSHMGLQTLETVVDRVRADAHSATGWRLTASQATKATRNIFGAIEATLSVAENGVRLSAYVEARRAGASIAQAGYLAKNLTVNFNKRGERSGAMNMLYMFYNAGVQGGAVLANMAKSKRGWKYLGAIVTTGFVLDMVNRMLSDDDNEDGVADYDQFSEYELSHNLIVPNPLAIMGVAGQPKYLKFPMPLGYNAAHNLGRNISNMFARKNKTWVDSLASIASGTADALNPIASGGNFLNFFAPTFADPFVDMAANTDYAGRAIIPERPGYGGVETPQSQLYWSSTDKSFVDIAAFLNSLTGGNEVRKGAIDWSPEALDYWTAFAAGGVGRFLLDMKYNITEGAPLLLAGKFDEIDTTRLPLINVVVGSNVDRAASSLYYEVNKEALTVEEEVNRFMERGEIARANAARTAHPVEFAMSSMFSGADKQIAGLRKQIRNIEAGRLPEEAKTKQIKLLREQIDTIMARALRTYYSAKDAVR